MTTAHPDAVRHARKTNEMTSRYPGRVMGWHRSDFAANGKFEREWTSRMNMSFWDLADGYVPFSD